MLSVETYDANERHARFNAPNRVTEAGQTEVFGAMGYPTRVNSERQLWRFADCMHELRFKRDFEALLGGALSSQEFDVITRIAREVYKLSDSAFDRKVLPTSSLIRALFAFRHLNHLADGQRLNILEIGPGSGYLGALLILAGHQYSCVEVTQGFYLYQSMLFEHFAGAQSVQDLASVKYAPDAAPDVDGTKSVLHLPWWHAYAIKTPLYQLGSDAIVANHVLFEMSELAFLLFARYAAKVLERESSFLFVESPGWNPQTKNTQPVFETFDKAGIKVLFELSPMHVLVGTGHVPHRLWPITAKLKRHLVPTEGKLYSYDDFEKFCRDVAGSDFIALDTQLMHLAFGSSHYI